MKDIFLSPIALSDLEQLIRNCLKAELQDIKPAPPPEPLTEYITRKRTAEILGISLPTLNNWSKRGIIPSYRIASRVRYIKEEVLNSLNKVQTATLEKTKGGK